MNQLVEDIVEEFDIQKTVLKKRSTKKEQTVYVEYDRLTFLVQTVSPTKINSSKNRNLITEVSYSNIITRLFQNKISLSNLIIKRNQKTNKLEISQNQTFIKGEFDYIFALESNQSYIYLNCDLISKKITVVFDYDIFKSMMYREIILEKDLAELPDVITIYCLDKNERSNLLGQINIPTQELFDLHKLEYSCKWLPDNQEKFDNIGFLYYNNNQSISIGNMLISDTIIGKFKPNVLYNQQGNVLQLQSMIQDVNSFKLNKEIVLYPFYKHDPATMLGPIKLDSKNFNNFNNFKIKINTSIEVGLVSNYLHLHLEESNDITNYQF
jgi:hypothetical protein